jgi:hypothetical protein
VCNTITKYQIGNEDIYNFDETGFIIGIISMGIVIISSNRRAKAKKIQPSNREWVTVVQAVNSVGYTVLLFIIITGKNHLDSWYDEAEFPPY